MKIHMLIMMLISPGPIPAVYGIDTFTNLEACEAIASQLNKEFTDVPPAFFRCVTARRQPRDSAP